jgi:intracellular septation protein
MRAEEQGAAKVDATVDSAPVAPGPKGESWLPMALDFGPLLVFFVASKFGGMFTGTGAFMAAIAIAVAVSQYKLGKVSPMLWLSAVLVLFFGGLTLYFQDQRFIQIKPTIIYSFFALMLLGGWLKGKPLLRYLLQAAYNGLDEAGWLKLSRNWGIFFAVMALANEGMRAALTFDLWLTIKVWGITIASFLFGLANLPMLMRHGLSFEEKPTEK